MRNLLARCFALFIMLLPAPLVWAQAPTWQALNDEAIAAYKGGDMDKAAAAASKALEAATAQLGPDHPSVASCANNLAAIYRSQKKYAEAEPLYARVLAIREKTAGPEGVETALALNNLAVLHDAQDQFDKAEPLYARALAIREKAQRRYDRAEPLLLKSLAIRTKALPAKDPALLKTQRDLWTTYVSTERYALAEQYQPEGETTQGDSRRLRAAPVSPKGNDPTLRGR